MEPKTKERGKRNNWTGQSFHNYCRCINVINCILHYSGPSGNSGISLLVNNNAKIVQWVQQLFVAV